MSELSEQHKAAIVKLLEMGRKLEAIKYAREAFGISLKDGVRLVDSVEKEMGPASTSGSQSFKQQSGLPKVFYYVFGGSGVLMVLGALVMLYFGMSAAGHAMKTTGEVVEFRYDEDAAYPVVNYSWQGDDYTYYSSTGSNPPSYEIGEQVEMLVDPSNPSDAMINTFSDRYLGMTILGGLGSFFLVMLYFVHTAFSKSKF